MFYSIAVLIIAVGIFVAWILIRAKQLPVDVSHNVLFVTAHPDDELMFFGPTLFSEIRARADHPGSTSKVHLLCLSQGDFYGDGHRRGKELADACIHLCGDTKLHADIFRLKVLNDDHFPDSPAVNWPAKEVISSVAKYIDAHQITKVITFDASGVSCHPNHKAIHQAFSQWRANIPSAVELWQLQTVPLWRKYSSWLDVLFTSIEQQSSEGPLAIHLLTLSEYLHIVQSLRRHGSQMLWFRYLYAITSRYMLINSLTVLE